MEPGSITQMLKELRGDVEGAETRLFERVYRELKLIAEQYMTRERGNRPADGGATDLVHDAYLRLSPEDFENRQHLFFAYARSMRQILVEQARAALTKKRGGNAKVERLDETKAGSTDSFSQRALNAIEVHELLDRLEMELPRPAHVVLLRFFGGLSHDNIAAVLDIDTRTVERDWAVARSRLSVLARNTRRE